VKDVACRHRIASEPLLDFVENSVCEVLREVVGQEASSEHDIDVEVAVVAGFVVGIGFGICVTRVDVTGHLLAKVM